MDIISHALWTNVAYLKMQRRTRIWAVLFGILPDIVSFGPFFVEEIAFHTVRGTITQFSAAGVRYITTAYNLTHSLVLFAAVVGIVWLVWRKPYLPLAGWGLHIVIDIFSHSRAFFPTPFLYPISNYTVDAISWTYPYFLLPNFAVLAAVYLLIYLLHVRRRVAGIDKM